MNKCISDIHNAVARGRISLEEQIRAYDLLDRFLEMGVDEPGNYCEEYLSVKDVLAAAYDEQSLKDEAEERLAPLKENLNEARFEAASAASLHEFAKEVFEIWQTSGVFARRRALKELRERAGFRLESHRIGNYVAKTFDLMNEAQARFARAQQALFAADVRYKIKQDTYGQIKDMIPSRLCLDPDAALEGKMRLCGLKYIKCVKEPVALDWPLDKREIII